MSNVDTLAGVCFIFLIIPIIAYGFIVWAQYSRIDSDNQRLTIMSTRTALFLPLYAILMYLSLVGPQAYVALSILITVVEGYSFYCFFAMIVTNMGGPAAVVNYMKNTGKGLVCCQGCCPSEPAAFYRKATWALFHFFITRVFIVILSAICYYSGKKAGKALYAIFSVLSAVVLFYGLSCLVLLYENVYANCKNLYGIVKLLLLKFSVGMIVLEGLIEQFIVLAGASPYGDDGPYDTAENTQREYCALVLLEFAIISLVYYYAYSYKITAPPASSSNTNVTAVEGLSFGSFMCQVFAFTDVFGLLTYTDAMNEPLTANKV